MGLFDVARGAAAAISKTAFPLHGAAAVTRSSADQGGRSRPLSTISGDGSDAGSEESRVRKRDMVSNMVTGGLASGIGWVLGMSFSAFEIPLPSSSRALMKVLQVRRRPQLQITSKGHTMGLIGPTARTVPLPQLHPILRASGESDETDERSLAKLHVACVRWLRMESGVTWSLRPFSDGLTLC